jgi:hypothetical protein
VRAECEVKAGPKATASAHGIIAHDDSTAAAAIADLFDTTPLSPLSALRSPPRST